MNTRNVGNRGTGREQQTGELAKQSVPPPLRLLRLPIVQDRTGLKKSTIYEHVKNGKFPKPVPLGIDRKAVGWVESEISAWIQECIQQRDGVA